MAYHHGDLRGALITAALEQVRTTGLHPLTLRGVARRAGVSPAAPYYHFRDKSSLLAAVAEEGFRLLAHAMTAAGRAQKKPRARLEAVGRAYVQFATSHRAHFLVMFGAELGGRWREAPLREAAAASFDALLDPVRAVFEDEKRGKQDPLDCALLAWSAAHGMATLWLEGPLRRVTADRRTLDQLAARITHLAVNGI